MVSYLNEQYLFILFFIVVFWQTYNIWLEPKDKLIAKYSSLMRLLEKLSCSKSNQALFEVIKHPSFEQMQRYVDKKFNKLNNKINSFYRLLHPNISTIGKEFIELVEETKTLYNEFIHETTTKNISVNRDKCTVTENAYKKFIFELERARNNYDEIDAIVEDRHLVIPLLSTCPFWIV